MINRERLRIANKKAIKVFKRRYPDYVRLGTHFANPVNDYLTPNERLDWFNRTMGMLRKTKVPCSCYCCGNPRRFKGVNHLTKQELQQQTREFVF